MKKNIIKESGFTLVELLVALLIGLLLAAAIVTIYLGSQSTFRAAQGVSRSQEATRFAVHFLKTDIRQAGYRGCSEGVSKRSTLNQTNPDYSASFEGSIFGWDYQGTNSGDVLPLAYDTVNINDLTADIAATRTANTEPATMWSSQAVQGTGINTAIVPVNLPPSVQALEPLRGSDIVSVTISEPLDIFIAAQPNQRNPIVGTVQFNIARQLLPVPSGVPNGGFVSIGDCSSVDIFQNSAQPGDAILSADQTGLSPGNTTGGSFGWQKKWDESALVTQLNTSIYFVGTGAGGSPSLYRYSSLCGIQPQPAAGAANACNTTVLELVEGVENLQVVYGEDPDGDGVPNRVVSADQVNDFDDVVSVELGVLVRSVDSGLDIDNTTTYVLAGNTSIDPPNDRFQRFVSNTTIRLHNQGL